METISIEIENDDGEEVTYQIPAKYEVCGRCQGKGSHVNPAIDEHGITQEEFDEDPGFEENYFGGVYDITCLECAGKRVVLEPNWDAVWPQGAKEAYEAHEKNQMIEDSRRRSEERFGF